MPFKSDKQRKACYATKGFNGKVDCDEWDKHNNMNYKMQYAGQAPPPQQNVPFNWRGTNQQQQPCPPGWTWSAPDNMCVQMPSINTRDMNPAISAPQELNPDGTPNYGNMMGSMMNNPNAAVTDPGVSFAPKDTENQYIDIPGKSKGSNKLLDPFFSSAYQGIKTGLAWLGGKRERNRQNQYMYNQYSTLGQNAPVNVQDYQPNNFSMYAKYGGQLKRKGWHRMPDGSWMSDAEMYQYGGQLPMYQGGGEKPREQDYPDYETYAAALDNYVQGLGPGYDQFVGPPEPDPMISAAPVIAPRAQAPAYQGNSIVDYLNSIGMGSSKADRKKIAQSLGMDNYDFSAAQNTALLNALAKNQMVGSVPASAAPSVRRAAAAASTRANPGLDAALIRDAERAIAAQTGATPAQAGKTLSEFSKGNAIQYVPRDQGSFSSSKGKGPASTRTTPLPYNDQAILDQIERDPQTNRNINKRNTKEYVRNLALTMAALRGGSGLMGALTTRYLPYGLTQIPEVATAARAAIPYATRALPAAAKALLPFQEGGNVKAQMGRLVNEVPAGYAPVPGQPNYFARSGQQALRGTSAGPQASNQDWSAFLASPQGQQWQAQQRQTDTVRIQPQVPVTARQPVVQPNRGTGAEYMWTGNQRVMGTLGDVVREGSNNLDPNLTAYQDRRLYQPMNDLAQPMGAAFPINRSEVFGTDRRLIPGVGQQRLDSSRNAYLQRQSLASNQAYKSGGWIAGAVNPEHKGYCTPMTKSTCTPRRKAFAKRAKAHFKEEGGYTCNYGGTCGSKYRGI